MNPELFLDIRLNQWAHWLRTANKLTNGYPEQSTIYGMMQTGGVLIQNAGYVGFISTLQDEQAQEIEALLKSLQKINEPNYDAITVYYLIGNTRAAAKKLGICDRVLQTRVKQARQFLLGVLSERYNNNFQIAA